MKMGTMAERGERLSSQTARQLTACDIASFSLDYSAPDPAKMNRVRPLIQPPRVNDPGK